MSTSRNFDWNDAADTVVVPEQAAIAIYLNPKGDIVIRQDGGFPDEDNIVVVAPAHAARLAAAIVEAAGVNLPRLLPPPVAPKDPTAADRQRRHRQRNRDGNRDVTDDDRDGEVAP